MKKIKFLKYFGTTILSLLIFSCSSSSSKDDEEPGRVYDLNVIAKAEIDRSTMSELKVKVLDQLLNKQTIKFSDITALLIEEQVKYYNSEDSKSSSVEAVTGWINDISTVNNDSSNIEDIKVLYQNNKLNMGEIKYNLSAISLPYILIDKKLQCYSSTMLHQLVLRNHTNFLNMNSVVIFEEGHVLSGYMSQEGNLWKLIGIENTVRKKGIKNYQDLTNYSGKDIRVVDSELFALVEIFKNEISNVNEVAKQVFDQTAQKYGFDVAKVNFEYSNLLTRNIPASYKSNESPLGFGNVDVDDKDQDIPEYDTITDGGITEYTTNGEIIIPFDGNEGDFIIPFELEDSRFLARSPEREEVINPESEEVINSEREEVIEDETVKEATNTIEVEVENPEEEADLRIDPVTGDVVFPDDPRWADAEENIEIDGIEIEENQETEKVEESEDAQGGFSKLITDLAEGIMTSVGNNKTQDEVENEGSKIKIKEYETINADAICDALGYMEENFDFLPGYNSGYKGNIAAVRNYFCKDNGKKLEELKAKNSTDNLYIEKVYDKELNLDMYVATAAAVKDKSINFNSLEYADGSFYKGVDEYLSVCKGSRNLPNVKNIEYIEQVSNSDDIQTTTGTSYKLKAGGAVWGGQGVFSGTFSSYEGVSFISKFFDGRLVVSVNYPTQMLQTIHKGFFSVNIAYEDEDGNTQFFFYKFISLVEFGDHNAVLGIIENESQEAFETDLEVLKKVSSKLNSGEYRK